MQNLIARFQGALSGGWAILCMLILLTVLTAEISLRNKVLGQDDLRVQVTMSGFDDEQGLLNPQNIIEYDRDKKLMPLDKLAKFSQPSLVRWILLRIKNPDNVPLVINLKKAVVKSLDVMEYDPPQEDSFQGNGSFRTVYSLPKPYFLKIFSAHHHVFLDPNTAKYSESGEQLVIVRATSRTRITIPIIVMPRDQAMGLAHAKSMFLGIYYGIILVMFFYNGFLMLFLRDRVYLLYILYLAAFAGTQLSVDGYIPEMFRYLDWEWTGRVGLTFNLLTVIFLVLYSSDFFVIPKASRPIYRLTQGVFWLFMGGLLATWIVDYRTGIMLAFQFNGICASFLLVLGFWSFLSGYKPARYFIVGNIILIVASLMMSLMMLQVIPSSDQDILDADFMIKLGSAFEVVFFSFALADRINVLVEEKHLYHVSLLREEIRRGESEQRAASETARALHYMNLAQMTQSLAHDIRRPFSILKIALDQLIEMSDRPEKQALMQSLILRLRENVGRSFDDVNRIIADVMEISSESTTIHRSSTKLLSLVQDSLGQVFPYEDSNINIHYDIKHKHEIIGDDVKLQRVLVNIIDNARQAMHGEGDLWIRTQESSDRYVTLSIRNSGSYIPEEDLNRIFEPFFTKGKRNGTGLGLAICKKIVEAHGGEISCNSSEEDGTTFFLVIPASHFVEETDGQELPQCSKHIRRQFLASIHSA
jgi:signal transduction histidine kinase